MKQQQQQQQEEEEEEEQEQEEEEEEAPPHHEGMELTNLGLEAIGITTEIKHVPHEKDAEQSSVGDVEDGLISQV